ncbi:MAG: Chaperone protein HtpG [Chlamydiales bacterium]|nr:Chaperone protein HtpG [Chlamydiales bacterium]MCH9619833.1 Chaperone protein HtpG [Chlamydiales bacterium]MCH9622740.1 Chaperone protein HtpG [Chlamydiales bacterium]
MAEGKLKIHSENILPIIKKWLYSDKDIFIRELISNACDAIYKQKRLSGKEDDYRIDLKIDEEKKTLTFSDNGIGMNSDEVENYIAQIAFSGAEEFIKKYQTEKEGDQVIGHFGLGFYSSYMVAKLVEIQTKSDEGEAVYWKCDGSSTYTIEKGERESRGTDIILSLSDEEVEFLNPTKLRQILHRYCSFLPHAIYLNGSQVNETPPLWLKAPSECTDKEYLDFYQKLFPTDLPPLFWIHLNIDYPFNLKGILYFPKVSQESDLKKEAMQLYCNRVFVSDNCKDLLPDYLMILRGAIDSPDIPLNVSRSYLQMDRTVRQLGTHISKKISDKLSTLYNSEREKFLEYWEDIELIVKFGVLQDDKFYERIKPLLVWKNNKEEWTTLEEYIERHQDKTVYYAPANKSHLLELYKEREVLVVRSTPIETAMIQFLEMKTEAKFKRIDAHLDETILDPEKEKKLLDSEGKTEAGKIAQLFSKQLDLEVEAKSLSSSSLPALLMMKEEERRMRDQMAYQNAAVSHAFLKPTFVVNTNNKLINAIFGIQSKDPKLAEEMVQQVYDLTCLSQKEMAPEKLNDFVTRSTELLEKLMN